jgi:hypothetical protein
MIQIEGDAPETNGMERFLFQLDLFMGLEPGPIPSLLTSFAPVEC